MLINLVKHANRSQISCSQCYNSIVTLNQRKKKKRLLNIEIDFLFRFLFFDIRTLTFFQVIMHLNLVMHAYRSQISCSQCYYNSIFTLNQRKKIEL